MKMRHKGEQIEILRWIERFSERKQGFGIAKPLQQSADRVEIE
jgi:hypothetical protein